ncbi:PREDICTED: putative RING-H2 finger protein ATL21B [Prunus mume]|uniref:RING-type E3 ubiquitin transferase n=1 Tax=Prunus mume TaxID=102107 RepID=A0ABM1LUI9_PRUMU|nr:PREDICTED: putative RING-H2 finger protein ATL21B [Prunus mume]
MSTLQFLITFLLLFFFIHHNGASAPAPICRESSCSSDNPPYTRFPFRLQNLQPSICGYSESFDLSCNNQNEAILTLPSSGHFIVRTIDYTSQNVWITDLNSCFPRLFLDHGLSLKGSPFSYANDLVNFTLLNCSSSAETPYPPISCLSNNEQYVITAVPSDSTVPPSCSVFSTASVPLRDPLDWSIIDLYGVELAWDDPDCRFCGRLGKFCGFENAKRSKLICFDIYKYYSSDNDTVRTSEIAIITCLGVLGLLLTTAFFLRLMRTCGRVQQPIVELSTITNQQPPAVMKGLDDATIESYPKIQLGQSWELPEPNDNTCPICLGTYKSKETLRTIPECNHYFHANCIDEWLRRNATCPLCRNPSEGNKVIIEA